MKKVTNKTIADMAGVSPAAVSIAMNGREGISEETRDKILKIAKELNYITNSTSVSLMREKSRCIAMLFRTDALLDDQLFYSEMSVNAMVAGAKEGLYIINTFVTGEPGMMKLPEVIINRGVDGVLICGDQEPGIYTELQKLGIPFVVLDSSKRDPDIVALCVDYEKAAFDATKHLIDLDHNEIAYMSNGALHDFNSLTLSGFQKAMEEEGLLVNPKWMQIELGDDEGLKYCVEKVISENDKPTAIFCTVDIYAINIIRCLHNMGYKVPKDISVISIDDILMSRYIIPSLTTVHIDRAGMITKALEMLEDMMAGGKQDSILMPPGELVVRESTRKNYNLRPSGMVRVRRGGLI